MRMLARVFAASIWAPGAIPADEWKFRNLKRVWLPAYDVVAILAGVVATVQGSPLLNRLFTEPVVNCLGAGMSLVALVCLIGVAFPRLWVVEFVGKVLLVGIIAAYAATIFLFASNPNPNDFIVLMLAFSLPFPLSRLNLLGEEIKERRVPA